jgi:lysophospholipase L1-like esterase
MSLRPPDSSSRAISFDGEHVAIEEIGSDVVAQAWLWSQGSVVDLPNALWGRSVSDGGTLVTGWKGDRNEAWIWKNSTDEPILDYLFENFGLANFGPYGTGESGYPYPQALSSGDGHVFTIEGAQWIANVRPLNVVGLGDSYSSGEGAPGSGYYEGIYLGNRCHRSYAAYSASMRPNGSSKSFRAIAQQPSTPDFSWKLIACSGAGTTNVKNVGRRLESEPSQLDQNVVNDETDLITITIGGNDAYFGPLLRECVLESDCRNEIADKDPEGRTWAQYAPALLEQVEEKVRLLLVEIRAEADQHATVIILGYPQLFAGKDCNEAEYPWSALPTPFRISAVEQNWIRDLSKELNKSLKRAADAAGVHFVGVADRFAPSEAADHNVCGAGEDWLNGVDLFPYKAHMFHPNETGHELGYAAAVQEFLKEKADLANPDGFFASGMPKNPPPAL